MDIKQNPFLSHIFFTTWLNQFKRYNPIFTFDFIEDLRFYKTSKFPIYVNLGRNLTKGVSYKLRNSNVKKFKNLVILIYDIPGYFNVKTSDIPNQIKIYRIKQYPGYLTNLTIYKGFQDYLQSTFSKKTRAKLKRYEGRLELCFDISYKMFHGHISKEEYDFVFNKFKMLLDKRFADKQITNNNLNSDEWNFYSKVALPLILEKQASLFVVYNGSDPIAITLNYMTNNILFHGITVFDIDYSKFHIGKIALMKLFSWCFDNNIQTFDFSKGHFDYKTHWMNKSYTFEYHIIYNSSSFVSKMIAYFLKVFFKLKQYLREKELNTILHQLTFWIKKGKKLKKTKSKFSFYNLSKKYPQSELKEIRFNSNDHLALKSLVSEFLFLNKEALKNLRIWKVLSKESTYLFQGKETSKLLVIH